MKVINNEQLEAELVAASRRVGTIPFSITQWAIVYMAIQCTLRRHDLPENVHAVLDEAADTIRALTASGWGPQMTILADEGWKEVKR